MSILPITFPPKKLAQTISSSAMTFKLSNIKQWNGANLTPAEFGTEGYGVFIDSTRTQIEIFKFDPATIADESVTILARGLEYNGGDTEVAGNKFAWPSNDTTVQLGTDAPQLFRDFLSKSNTATITAKHTYTELPESSVDPVDNDDLTRKEYVDGRTQPYISNEITQVAHGFAAGDIIRISGTNTFAKAKADSAANAEVAGVVVEIVSLNIFRYAVEGIITVGVPAQPAGTVLFLSPTTAGTLTATEPNTVGEVSIPLAVVQESGMTMLFHKFRPYVVVPAGTTPSGSSTVTTVVQTGHGFSVGNMLRHNGTSYVKAQANNDVNAEVVGIVSSIVNLNTFVLTSTGYVGTLSGLTAGTVYFLDTVTAGAYTSVAPTTLGYINKPLLIATSTTEAFFFNMRGVEVSTATTGEATARKVYQPLHGLVAGDVVNFNGTIYTKAKADTAANAEVLGIVASVTDANNFILLTAGYIDTLSGLTSGALHFLSPSTAGALTTTETTTPGEISKPLLKAISTTAGHFINMRGVVITTGAPVEGTSVQSTGETGGTKFLREDGDGTCSWQSLPDAGAITDQYFTSSGTWTKPSGLKFVIIEVQAAGGAGGGVESGTSKVRGGGGGGSGGYAKKKILAASLGATETVTIGATTSFGSHASTTVGSVGTTSATNSIAAGGAGGTATGGDLNINGVVGGIGSGFSGAVAATGGEGGSSFLGVAGTRTQSTALISNGVAATGYGAGGSGSCKVNHVAADGGGSGAPGIIIVHEHF